MRAFAILIVMPLASPLILRGQSIPTAEPSAPSRTYHLRPEDDDWSFLADPAKREEWTYESSRASALGRHAAGKVNFAIGDLMRSEISPKELSNG